MYNNNMQSIRLQIEEPDASAVPEQLTQTNSESRRDMDHTHTTIISTVLSRTNREHYLVSFSANCLVSTVSHHKPDAWQRQFSEDTKNVHKQPYPLTHRTLSSHTLTHHTLSTHRILSTHHTFSKHHTHKRCILNPSHAHKGAV